MDSDPRRLGNLSHAAWAIVSQETACYHITILRFASRTPKAGRRGKLRLKTFPYIFFYQESAVLLMSIDRACSSRSSPSESRVQVRRDAENLEVVPFMCSGRCERNNQSNLGAHWPDERTAWQATRPESLGILFCRARVCIQLIWVYTFVRKPVTRRPHAARVVDVGGPTGVCLL